MVPSDIHRAIEALNHEFAYRVDFGPSESAAELFTADGWYGWGSKRSVGREEIRAAYRLRAARGIRTARHLCTNLRLQSMPGGEVEGRSVMLIFAEDGPPPHPAVPLLVADVHDRYAQIDGEWFFRWRQLMDVFADPQRAPVLPLAKSQ
jgi:hypothetical protein